MKKRNIKIILLIFLVINIVSVTKSKYVIQSKKVMDVHISIDKNPPTISVIDLNKSNLDKLNNKGIGQATIFYEDDLSGIEKAIWKYNDKEEKFDDKEENNLENNTIFTNKGWYDIELTDKAGNITIYHFYIEEAVCKIQDTFFSSITSALNNISPNNINETTIIMLKNTIEDVNINGNKNIELDINGHEIEGSFTIEEGSTLSSKNGSINSNNKPVFDVNGNLNILSGAYEATKTDTIIVSKGICNIKGGEIIHNSNYHTIHTYGGIANISGGVIANYEKKAIVYLDGGAINLYGGSYIGNNSEPYIINSSGTLNIDGAKINSKETSVIYSYSNTNVISGNISSTNANTFVIERGTSKITGGKISNTVNKKAIIINSGDVSISGGNITSNNNNAILQNAGNVNIGGGTLISNTWCTYGINSGNLEIKGGNIICQNSHDALHISGGTVNISGGTLETKARNSAVVRVASDSDTGKYYKDIILNISGGKYKQTTTNTNVTYAIIDIASNIKNTVLNFNGANISSDKYGIIANYSQDTTVNIKSGTINSIGGYGLYNLGKLNISGGNVISSGKYTIWNSLDGTANITGGFISNTSNEYAIYKYSGTIKITGGIVSGKTNF